MATLKGKWKFNENIVLPDSESSAQATCIFDWGDIKMLSDPEAINLTSGIEFNHASFYRGGLYANNICIVGKDGHWVENYLTWAVIDFGEAERIVSNKFYDIFTANAVQLPVETVTITYKGETIESLKAGQTATLKTAGGELVGDITVSVPEGVGSGEVVEEWDGTMVIK